MTEPPGRGGKARLLLALVRGHATRHPLEVALALLGVILGASVVVGIDASVAACVAGFRSTVADLAGDSTHRIVARSGPLRDRDFIDLRTAHPELPLTPVIDRRVGLVRDNDAATDDTAIDDDRATAGTARLVGIDVFTYRSLESLESLDDQLSAGAFRAFQTEPDTVLLVDALAGRLDAAADDTLTIVGGADRKTVRVAGVFTLDEPAASSAPDLMVADIATAQELTGSIGLLDRIETRLAPPSDADSERPTEAEVRALLPPHLELVTTEGAGERLEELIAAYRLNLLSLSMMAAFVAVFIVYNASLVSVNRRRETLAILRCVGASPLDLALVFLLEALLLGLVGAALGIILGRALAAGFVELIAGTIEDLYAAVRPAALSIGLGTLAKGGAVAVGSALLGALVPVIAASRVPPVSAMASTASARRSGAWVLVLAGFGLASFAAAGLVWRIAPTESVRAGYAIAASVWLGFALVTPAMAGLAARAAATIARLVPMGRGLPLLLAATDIRRSLGVSGIAVAAMMLAMAMNVAILTTVGSFRSTVLEWLDNRYRSDLYIAPELAISEGVQSPLDPALVDRVVSHPQAAEVLLYRHTDAEVRTRPVMLTATDLRTTERLALLPLAGQRPDAPLDTSSHVYISQPLAIKLDARTGDDIAIPTPTGPWTTTVRGVFHDFVADRGTVLIDLDAYRQRWDDDAINAAHVNLKPGIAAAEARPAWAAELTSDYPVVVHDHQRLRAETRRVFDRTFRITDVLGWLSGLVALCGLTGALLALTTARKQEFAVLLAVGARPSQLALRVACEGLLIALVAVALAIAAGAALGEILASVIQYRSFGWTIDTAPQPMAWAQAAAFAIAGAAIATILPFRMISGAAPAGGLRDE